jgi:hypothetical protein
MALSQTSQRMSLPGPRQESDQRNSGGRFLTPLLPRERETRRHWFWLTPWGWSELLGGEQAGVVEVALHRCDVVAPKSLSLRKEKMAMLKQQAVRYRFLPSVGSLRKETCW